MNILKIQEVKTDHNLSKEFLVTIPHAQIASAVQKGLESKAKTIRMDGFRPGKVPMSVVEQREGNHVVSDVMDKLLSETAQKVLTDHKIRAATRPHFHPKAAYKKGEDFSYTMHVEVLPDVPALDLSALEVNRYKIKEDPKKLDELNALRARAAGENKAISKDRKTKSGDVVKIDFEGHVDGKLLPGGTAKDYELELGANQFIPGFEEGLVGQDKGKKLTLNLAFPVDYHEKSIAGKDVKFHVTIHEIMERAPAEVNDALAEKHGYKSLKEMEEANKDILARSHANITRAQEKHELLNKLAKMFSFDLPPGMVKLEIESICQQLAQDEGIEKPDEKQLKAWEKEYKAIAERRVRLGLVLADVGHKHKVSVSQKELSEAVMAEARRYPGQEKLVFEYYQKHASALNHMRAQVLEEKTVDFILKNAKIKEKEVSEDALKKLSEDMENSL